jgi:hypothetical protein
MKLNPYCYVFGYGSLMYPNGINGRGMKHSYGWADLNIGTLEGYRRGMYSGYAGLLYYGLRIDPAEKVIGVLVPMYSKQDFAILIDNEGASNYYKPPMYNITNVSHLIHPNLFSKNGTFALTNTRVVNGRTPPWYVAHVWEGIQHWGDSIILDMKETGIIKPTPLQMKTARMYDLIKRVRTAIMH